MDNKEERFDEEKIKAALKVFDELSLIEQVFFKLHFDKYDKSRRKKKPKITGQ